MTRIKSILHEHVSKSILHEHVSNIYISLNYSETEKCIRQRL